MAAIGATAGIIGSAEAQQTAIDPKIQSLDGFRSDPGLLACLRIQNGTVQRHILDYISAFKQKKVSSQEEMNRDAVLIKKQKEITDTINSSTFKKEFISEFRKTYPRGHKFLFEKASSGSINDVFIRLDFYYAEKDTPSIIWDTNGLYETGG